MADRQIIDYRSRIPRGTEKAALTAGMVLPADAEENEKTLDLNTPHEKPIVIRLPRKAKWILG
jgi:hypothetical protein